MSEEEVYSEEIRPDVRFNIAQISERIDTNQGGFECLSCEWESTTIELSEDLSDPTCPECGEADIENKLSANINHAYECWRDIVDKNPEQFTAEFVPYEQLNERAELTEPDLDACLNSLLVDRDAAVMVQDGRMVVNLEMAKVSERAQTSEE